MKVTGDLACIVILVYVAARYSEIGRFSTAAFTWHVSTSLVFGCHYAVRKPMGQAGFLNSTQELIFGKVSKNIATVQTPSGSGAISLGLRMMRDI